MPPKRKGYSADFKLQVAQNSNRAAEGKIGVSEKLVRDWWKADPVDFQAKGIHFMSFLKEVIKHF